MSHGGRAPQAQARRRPRSGSRERAEKKLIESAYTLPPEAGLVTWCEDEAGPFQTIPYAGSSWQMDTKARPYDHEYIRNGTAKLMDPLVLMTLFHPATGWDRVRGTQSTKNEVLHR